MSTSFSWTRILLCLSFISLRMFCAAQVQQADRLEIPLRPGDMEQEYSVVSAGTSGLVLYNELRDKTQHFLEVVHIDTALHFVWNGSVELDADKSPLFSSVANDVLYLLCRNAAPAKSDLTLVTLNLITRQSDRYPILNYVPFKPSEMLVLDSGVMIGGVFNYRPFVLHFSPAHNKSKVLPGLFNDTGELVQLKASPSGNADIIVSGRNAERRRCLWIRNYDSGGNLLKTTVLGGDDDKNLIFGRSVATSDDDQVVAGVYGRNSTISRGIFVARINPIGEYQINYYSFADLKNFFRFMRASKEQRIMARIERRRVRGKKIKFNYRILVNELIPYRDQYVLLGEAFYPTYKSQTPAFATPGGFPTRQTAPSVFDGYQYTHAVVIGFSKTGKLVWDNSFEINDVKSFKHEQFVKILTKEDHISLLYLYDGMLLSKIISGNEVREGKTAADIKTSRAGDRPAAPSRTPNKLEYWYPGCLYAYGRQQIVNVADPGLPVHRRVFFINKITTR